MLTLKFSQSKKKNEFKALAELIDEYEHHDLMPIFIADRGFFAYNVFAHAIENKSFFLIRAKDKNLMLPSLIEEDAIRQNCGNIMVSMLKWY